MFLGPAGLGDRTGRELLLDVPAAPQDGARSQTRRSAVSGIQRLALRRAAGYLRAGKHRGPTHTAVRPVAGTPRSAPATRPGKYGHHRRQLPAPELRPGPASRIRTARPDGHGL